MVLNMTYRQYYGQNGKVSPEVHYLVYRSVPAVMAAVSLLEPASRHDGTGLEYGHCGTQIRPFD